MAAPYTHRIYPCMRSRSARRFRGRRRGGWSAMGNEVPLDIGTSRAHVRVPPIRKRNDRYGYRRAFGCGIDG